MGGEKIFLQYGFDLEISVKDVFTLESLGGILFLHLLRENGDRIISRRRIIDEKGNTEPFDINKLSKRDKEELVLKFIELKPYHSRITRFLGLSHAYIGNLKKKRCSDGKS